MSKTKTVKQSGTPVAFQDRIVITKKEPEKVTPGGIIIPSGVITKENIGFVVAVGPLVGRTVSSSVTLSGEVNQNVPKIGDKVVFGEYAGMEIEFEGQNFLVVKEADVLCKI